MQAEYAWLTSPLHNSLDEFLGDVYGLPLPFLLRHGNNRRVDPAPYAIRSKGEWARLLSDGAWRLQLSAVEAEGRPIKVEHAFFLPEAEGCPLVVSPQLYGLLAGRCDFETEFAPTLISGQCDAHQWVYSMPATPDDDSIWV